MILWIIIATTIISIIGISICDSDKTKQTKSRLKEQMEHAENLWIYSPCDYNAPLSVRKKLQEEYYTAKEKYSEFLNSKEYKRTEKKKVIQDWFCGIFIGSCIALVLAIFVLIGCYSTAGGEQKKLEAEHAVLSWEVKNNIYSDEGDDVVGKKELYNQVREWNAELAKNQYYEKNFWIGPFVPNIYEGLKPIELE